MSFALKYVVLGYIAFFGSQSLVGAVPLQEPIQTRRDDYTYTPGVGAHKIVPRFVTLNTARRSCEEDGAYLGIMNSVAEAEAVLRLGDQSNVTNVWVGLHDLYHEDEFVTIHGESVTQAGFDIWLPGAPNNWDNREHCVVLLHSTRLNDWACTGRAAFVCELPEVQGTLQVSR